MDGHWREPDPDLETELRASQLHWQSEGREGAPLVAPGRDFRRLNLRERVLSGAQLQGADLREALLDQANLVRAALDGAQLDGAHLFGTNASKASLVEASAIEIRATRSIWVRARFTRAALRQASLENATLQAADFVRSDLRGSVLRDAHLEGALLASAALDDADFTGAWVEGMVVDAEAFSRQRGADAVHGDPTFRTGGEVPPPESGAAAFESLVGQILRAANVGDVHVTQRQGLADFVVAFPDGGYVAVEAKATIDPQAIEAAARRADVVVVPDRMEFLPREPVPVLPVSRLTEWLRKSAPVQRRGHGGLALAIRELSRLRPWLAFARQHRRDPSFVSRISVWIDTKEPLMLTGADRRLADLIPAAVDGVSWARGVRWAEQHIDELDRFDTEVREQWRRAIPDLPRVEELARRGWELENELATEVGSGSTNRS